MYVHSNIDRSDDAQNFADKAQHFMFDFVIATFLYATLVMLFQFNFQFEGNFASHSNFFADFGMLRHNKLSILQKYI